MSHNTYHARREIREAAKAALVNRTIALDRVSSSRKNPLSQNPTALGGKTDLPAIVIYTRTTRSEVFDESPRRYRNVTELVVEAVLELTGEVDDIDDEVDAFEKSVVELLLADDTLGGKADDLRLTGSALAISEEGAKLLGAAIISFDASFFSNYPAEGSPDLDNLAHVHTEYSLEGAQPDEDDRAKTDIEELDT